MEAVIGVAVGAVQVAKVAAPLIAKAVNTLGVGSSSLQAITQSAEQIVVPLITQISPYAKITETITEIAKEVNVNPSTSTLDAFLKQISLYNFGADERDLQTKRRTNVTALLGQDLKAEYERNKNLIISLLALQKRTLENTDKADSADKADKTNKADSTQIIQLIAQTQKIIQRTMQRNQDIMQECLLRAETDHSEKDIDKRIKQAYWRDREKLNEMREKIQRESQKAAKDVLTAYEPDLKSISEQSFEVSNLQKTRKVSESAVATKPAPFLTSYKQATSHEKTLKGHGVERSPEAVQKIAEHIKEKYPEVSISMNVKHEFMITSRDTTQLCTATRESEIYHPNETFNLNTPSLDSALEILRQSQLKSPTIRIVSLHCPGTEISDEKALHEFMQAHGIPVATPPKPEEPKPIF